MKKLFLLDAYALIYRSYYALIRSPRINSKGMNTSAVMGFVNTLNEVITKERPDYLGVAFDHGKTFRHEAFPQYKAQRDETPEDIRRSVPVIKDIPVVSTMFSSLTIIDYAAFVLAIVMYIIMYKTVIGFRLRAIGVNSSAASSLGINVARYQIISTTLSGAMIGLAGCLLSLGSVTLFIQNISSARGYVALAANNLCQGHPIGALLSSALFGFTKALAQVLQNTAVKQQLLECIPYISTIVAMAVYNAIAKRRAKVIKH